jgi:hypothetical protein
VAKPLALDVAARERCRVHALRNGRVHAPHLVADVLVLAAIALVQAIVVLQRLARLDLEQEQVAQRRDHGQVNLAELLTIAVHRRPVQVVKHIKAVGQSLGQQVEHLALAVRAQGSRGGQGGGGVDDGHGK